MQRRPSTQLRMLLVNREMEMLSNLMRFSKKKGDRKECSCDDDASPDGITSVDEVHPVDNIGDHVEDKKSKIWMEFIIYN